MRTGLQHTNELSDNIHDGTNTIYQCASQRHIRPTMDDYKRTCDDIAAYTVYLHPRGNPITFDLVTTNMNYEPPLLRAFIVQYTHTELPNSLYLIHVGVKIS